MKAWIAYIFWPNPGNANYDNPKVIALLMFCALLVLASFVISRWRDRLQNQSLKKVSRSWSGSTLWFGLTGLLFTISRVEQIQFLAMRALWLIWFITAVLYIAIQVRAVRTRTYEVIRTIKKTDARAKYLPKRKK